MDYVAVCKFDDAEAAAGFNVRLGHILVENEAGESTILKDNAEANDDMLAGGRRPGGVAWAEGDGNEDAAPPVHCAVNGRDHSPIKRRLRRSTT